MKMTRYPTNQTAEAGFTVPELVLAMTITAVLLTLGAFAVRQFWFVQALDGSADEVVAQLRQVQQRSTAENHPLVYGVHFREDSSTWQIVRYVPGTAATQTCIVSNEDGVPVQICTAGSPGTANTCTAVEKRVFGTGAFAAPIEITAADFSSSGSETSEQTICRGSVGTPPKSKDKFVMFYARGNATPGSVTLRQPSLGRTKVISVAGVTGRVSKS